VRSEIYPSLLGSGRRIGAGPGLRAATAEGFGRAFATTLVVGLCTVLMASPALLAALSIVVDLQIAPWLTRLKVMPVLEAGRLLVTLVLATRVIATKELE
jgi:hypothetical protein